MERTVIALGFFDGVHRGHGALLQRTAERARELGAEPVVFTFDRPPKEVVTGQPVYLINSAEDRQGLIRRLYGIDRIILAPFDLEMMTMSWEDFVTELLVKRCGAVHLVAGHDHRFGHKNAGNAQLLREKCAQLGLGCDIIPEVVHDGITVSSTYIRKLVAADAHVQGVDLAKNFGQHAALMAGFHQCTGDIVVCLDDDGQTPANEVGKLLDKINEGYDVVYANYDNKRQAGWRNLGSWVNSKMTEVMLGKPPELVVNSYFAARRFIVDEMLRYEHCYPYVIGLVLRSTKRIANVSVHHRAREEGRSGYTISKLLNLWMNGFTSFSVKPLRLATYAGTVFAGFGFLYLIYIIIDHFVRGAAPMGWASTTALLLLLGGMILLVLGLIGEYVGRIYMCANAAPQYVAREYLHHEGDAQ